MSLVTINLAVQSTILILTSSNIKLPTTQRMFLGPSPIAPLPDPLHSKPGKANKVITTILGSENLGFRGSQRSKVIRKFQGIIQMRLQNS